MGTNLKCIHITIFENHLFRRIAQFREKRPSRRCAMFDDGVDEPPRGVEADRAVDHREADQIKSRMDERVKTYWSP